MEEIRRLPDFFVFIALCFEQTEPLGVPLYAFGAHPYGFSLSNLHYFPSIISKQSHKKPVCIFLRPFSYFFVDKSPYLWYYNTNFILKALTESAFFKTFERIGGWCEPRRQRLKL